MTSLLNRLMSYNVLTCMIIVSDSPALYDPEYEGVQYVFKEVNEISISSSYNNLVSKATITLPRATMLETTTGRDVGVKTKDLIGNDGAFKIGQRVTIYIGYDDDGSNQMNKRMFDGYIISVDSDNPYTLYCEDIAYKLKKNAVQPFSSGTKGTKINDIIDIVLKDTGLSLHPLSERMNIEIGNVRLEKSKSAAEILESWKKFGLVSFIKYYQGVPYLALSRTFFSTNTDQTLIANDDDTIPVIDFQENVVSDSLKFLQLDMDTLALTAVSLYPDNTRLQLTIIRDKADPSQFQVINETRLSKKQVKQRFGNTYDDMVENYKNTQNKQDKFDLSGYNVRTYHNYNVTRDQLIANAKSAFNNISQTGIEGDVTIFGDYGIQPGQMVRLYDERNPEKNGVFVVSEVHTTFGVNGYRQKLKMPFKRSN